MFVSAKCTQSYLQRGIVGQWQNMSLKCLVVTCMKNQHLGGAVLQNLLLLSIV